MTNLLPAALQSGDSSGTNWIDTDANVTGLTVGVTYNFEATFTCWDWTEEIVRLDTVEQTKFVSGDPPPGQSRILSFSFVATSTGSHNIQYDTSGGTGGVSWTGGSLVAAGAWSGTTWNPNNKGSTNVILSSGNLTATVSAETTGNELYVRAVNAIQVGEKRYFEVHCGTPLYNVCLGVATSLYQPGYHGSDAQSVGYWMDGSVDTGGATVSTIELYDDNDIVRVAVDHSNKRIWFAKNGGNWNNSASADPATNTGGIAYTATLPLYPMVSLTGGWGENVTGKWSGFTYSVPSGFSAGGTAYTLTADSGSYTIAGTAANLARTVIMPADAGSFAIAGSAVGMYRDYTLLAEAGTYVIAGSAVDFSLTRSLIAESGSFAITGQPATLTTSARLGAESGSFAIAGQDVTMFTDRVLQAESGAIAIAGGDVNLLYDRHMNAESGAFTIYGNDVVLSKTAPNKIIAESGSFTITGSDALLIGPGDQPPGAGGIWIYKRRRRRST